tara:strand:- start:5287 stop:5448 length:162 start_codon:yes stop_codon:yes gene_type:complete
MKDFNEMEDNKENLENSELKTWHAPKLTIEDVGNTKGGNFTCNSPGDDGWYSS